MRKANCRPIRASIFAVPNRSSTCERKISKRFCKWQMNEPPQPSPGAPQSGQALIWFAGQSPPLLVVTPKADQERRRHLRQYAQGELSSNQSFYFRGPESKLNLRAQNLETFLQMADE